MVVSGGWMHWGIEEGGKGEMERGRRVGMWEGRDVGFLYILSLSYPVTYLTVLCFQM